MTAPVVLLVAALAAGAPGDLRLDAGLHLDARGRTIANEGGPDEDFAEATAIPRVAVTKTGPDLSLGAAYAPRLRAPDLGSGIDLVYLHVADLQAELRRGRALKLSASARGERGTTDLLTLSRAADSELQTITTTGRLRYRALRGDLGLEWRASPRTTLTSKAGAFIEGGEGAEAEAVRPLDRGVRAEAGLGYRASRLDDLRLRLSGLGTRLDRGPTSAVATLEASWQRRFSPTLHAWLGGGATGAYEDPRGAIANRELLPTGEVGVAYTPPPPPPPSEDGEDAPAREAPSPHISSRAALRLSPNIDRATGEVDQQLEGTLRFGWPVTSRWSLGAGGAAAVVWQDPGDTRRGRLDALLAFALTPRVQFGLGVYGSWQRADAPAVPSFTEAGALISLELEAPPLYP